MTNRLASETSPYLLQHADNPVDWYPWGPEAFERARAEDKPIVLSVGYAACHWCHVMEHESFEDPGTAALMNEHFVNVKVDREERPDVDSIYMAALQAMTGHGGWPMTVFLTPHGAPFYGGTYFPPEPRHGMPSFRQMLQAVAQAYRERRAAIEKSADEIRRVIQRAVAGEAPAGVVAPPILGGGYPGGAGPFDRSYGGFAAAPKFPQPLILEFLLRYHRRSGASEALTMVEHTLQAMARGGIHDQLGGGFHRYAVDRRWLVPHFEKMLYDNALLARAYLEAYQATGAAAYRRVAESTIDYVLDDLTSPQGGFYSSRDADSEGEEGRYYLWTATEVDPALHPEEARLLKRYYDVTPEGNFEGKSILHVAHDVLAVARAESLEPDELLARLERARTRMLEVRRQRVPPFRDEKILTGWNGLMLRALADAAAVLGRADYRAAAERAAEFLLAALRPGDRLVHVYKDGIAKVPGYLEDYAALADGLLALYEATFDERWLMQVRWLAERIVELFWDPEERAFFDAPADGERLIVRPRDVTDHATPSGSSLAIELLLRLRVLFGEERYGAIAEAALARAVASVERYPAAFGRLLSALDFHLSTPKEIVIVGPRADPRTEALLATVRARFLPHRVLAAAEPGHAPAVPIPLLDHREAVDGKPTAFVCEHYVCRQPVTEPEALAALLD
ncbi:MAG: thioredoxin domain-containing protein [Gemmatimonadetes bacterium]|nr:thioredoxin domain-containing protein [Gemmatimonadota bacterium]